MNGDLTNVSAAAAWLGINSPDAGMQARLQSLITAASTFILNQIGRETLDLHTVTNVVDGSGSTFILLREWPVIAVQSVGWYGMSLTTPLPFGQFGQGFMLEPPVPSGAQQRLSLSGYCFPRGRGNVQVVYTAGFYVSSEVAYIPASAPYTVAARRFFSSDGGVTYASGAALVPVAGNPAAGQYAVDGCGNYTFAAADSGRQVGLAYSYVPADLQQVATELVGERWKAKDRIGVTGQTLAGKESITYFSQKDMNAFATSVLQNYMRVTPS